MSKLHIAPTPARYTHSLRILFTIDSSAIEIASVTRVAMRAPGSIAAPVSDKRTGYWFEILGSDGELLYHRPLRDPLPDSVEVFDDPGGGTLRRVPRNRPKQAKFEIIVPDLPGTSQFLLYGPAPNVTADAASGVLLRTGMDELRALSSRDAQQPSQDGGNTGREKRP